MHNNTDTKHYSTNQPLANGTIVNSSDAARSASAQESPFAKIAKPLIAQDFRIIPLKARGKTPLLSSWKEYQDRAPTAEEYARWFDDYPEANVGILTGITVDVLDVDDAAQADEYLAKQALPLTRMARTGKPAGRHNYYKHPPGLKISCSVKNLPGMDVRGNGGYVVGPGSIHENGTTYIWEETDTPIVDMPSWLIKASAADKHDPHYKFTLTLAEQAEKLAKAEEGERNVTWNKAVFIVAKLAKNDDDRRLIEERLIPIARAIQADDDIGIRGTLQSAFSAAQRKAAEEAANPIKWPFVLREDGVYVVTKAAGESEAGAEPERIYGHLELPARFRDADGKRRGLWARVITEDGDTNEFAITHKMLAAVDGGNEMRTLLAENSLWMSTKRRHREAQLDYVNTTTPAERWLLVDRIGWQKDLLHYVLPDKVFGPTQGERILYKPEEGQRQKHNYNVKGTLQEWQNHVAKLCIGNSSLSFSIAVAVAAALIPIVPGAESGGFHFFGEGSAGKTTALQVAGSVWGGGENGYGETWRATDNGVEGVAESYSDTLLTVDEMSLISANAAGAAVFTLASGKGKSRMKQDSSMRRVKTWRTLFVSTGHVTLADKISENGQRVNASKESGGQEVRIICLPHDAGAGKGMFEDLHESANGGVFSNQLKEAASLYYGTPIRAFLERLFDSGIDGARATLKAYMKQFVESLELREGTETHGQVRRVADRFALVAAAGKLATDYGILAPWGPDEAFSAARKCFKAWVANRGGTGASEDAAYRAKLVTKIQQGKSHFEIVGPPPSSPDDGRKYYNPSAIGDCWGFRQWVQDEGWHLYVYPGTWRETICQGMPYQRAAELLIEDGFMDAMGDNGRPKNCRLPNPDGSKSKSTVRFYHIKPSLAGGPDSAQEHDIF